MRLSDHLKALLHFSDIKRPWGYFFVAALAIGLPVLVGAWLNQFAAATIASMGGLVILYLGQRPLPQRMLVLVLCSLGFVLSFALGVFSSVNIYLSAITLAIVAFLATLICRRVALPPPGSFFFILVACLGGTLPYDPDLTATRTVTLLAGSVSACLLAAIYSFGQRRWFQPEAITTASPPDFRIHAIIIESTVIGLFIGGSYLFALLIELERPYWVPVSCAAIMQGASFRAVWHRNVHRIVGTVFGLGLAWLIFSLSPNSWALAAIVTALSFVIEALVRRNYGLAVIFITPLTVIFAEASMASNAVNQLMLTRLADIVLGCSIGFVGGWLIHHPALFNALETRLKKATTGN
jgi:uncharacterized membrane protein YccC